ncbi:MAG: radical SAM protein, partial [Bacteroidales bacterium]|nr:radical SAM protein [Bacteroidales bacterium]
MKKINEIFHSLQGEGFHTGTAAVFVRFSGCNLSCPFCDTDHRDGKMMSDEEIVAEVSRLREGASLVVLTGGEPSLFVDEGLLEKLHAIADGIVVAMETNGTRPLPSGVDFVTLSPKDQFVENAKPVLKSCSELKLVYPGCDPSKYDHIACSHRFLQPCDCGEGVGSTPSLLQPCDCGDGGDDCTGAQRTRANMAATVAYIKAHPQWRLSIQTHKILGI